MRQVKRSALVAQSPARMFALINDIERYPQFVPWCVGAQVLAASPEQITARLDIRRSILKASFTTCNRLTADSSVHMSLVDGPFRELTGLWTLTPVSGADGALIGCRVSLEVSFEFAAAVPGALLEPIFEQTLAALVDAFVARARSQSDEPAA
jgi:ribosome-associated toxin RatA of RatAB toxin-antitoxin module